jgi:hypothetical protein
MKSRHQGMRRGGEWRCDVYNGRRERSTWRIQQAWALLGRSSPVAWWSSAFTPSRPGPDDDGGGVGEGHHLAVNAEEASRPAHRAEERRRRLGVRLAARDLDRAAGAKLREGRREAPSPRLWLVGFALRFVG